MLHYLRGMDSGEEGLCSEQENPKIKVLASYSQIKLETEIPTTLVPRLNKGQTCRLTES